MWKCWHLTNLEHCMIQPHPCKPNKTKQVYKLHEASIDLGPNLIWPSRVDLFSVWNMLTSLHFYCLFYLLQLSKSYSSFKTLLKSLLFYKAALDYLSLTLPPFLLLKVLTGTLSTECSYPAFTASNSTYAQSKLFHVKLDISTCLFQRYFKVNMPHAELLFPAPHQLTPLGTTTKGETKYLS